jgi:small subunit ribosomal protein S8
MTDPIADMLTRIRNAIAVRKSELVLPCSRLKLGIAEILEREGYVEKVERLDKGQAQESYDSIRIVLKYQGGKSAITDLKRISRPGLRVYATKDELPRVLNNIGIAIISTSKGLLTNKEAKKAHIGGEVLCEIY